MIALVSCRSFYFSCSNTYIIARQIIIPQTTKCTCSFIPQPAVYYSDTMVGQNFSGDSQSLPCEAIDDYARDGGLGEV